jgi:hypothetical protein
MSKDSEFGKGARFLLCQFVGEIVFTWEAGRVKRWSCGVPVKGEKVLEGVDFPSIQS